MNGHPRRNPEHLRACGATVPAESLHRLADGPSPRERGGSGTLQRLRGRVGPSPRGAGRRCVHRLGSALESRPIPACSGEAGVELRGLHHHRGPSPRARGRRLHGGGVQALDRCIPARARQTATQPPMADHLWAHPPRAGGQGLFLGDLATYRYIPVRGANSAGPRKAARWTGASPRAGRMHFRRDHAG